jgi:hypothetical protein
MTKQERVAMYQAFLTEEGYAPKLDSDGDVTFKFEGGFYIIIVDEKDPEYFRLAFPGFWSIDNDAERAKASMAALWATGQTKVAKVFLAKENTYATIEMFCSPPDVFKAVFRRSLSALKAAVETFRAKMMET